MSDGLEYFNIVIHVNHKDSIRISKPISTIISLKGKPNKVKFEKILSSSVANDLYDVIDKTIDSLKEYLNKSTNKSKYKFFIWDN